MKRDAARRAIAWLLSLCMVAGLVDLTGFTAYAADVDVTIDEVEIKDGKQIATYDAGAPIMPELKVSGIDNKTGGRVEVTDPLCYEVRYTPQNPTEAGRVMLTVTGRRELGYTGSATTLFVIVPKDISECSIADITGKAMVKGVNPNLVVQDSDVVITDTDSKHTIPMKGLVKGTDYTYEVTVDASADDASGDNGQGIGTLIVHGVGNYQGTVTKTFPIEILEPQNLTFHLGRTSVPYVGKDIPVTVDNYVTDVKYKETPLQPEEYEIKYDDNARAGTAKVWIEGLGRYTQLKSEEQEFSITKQIDDTHYKAAERITVDPISIPYAGAGKKTRPTSEDIHVKDPDYADDPEKWELKYGEDYTIVEGSFENDDAVSEGKDQASFVIQANANDGKYKGIRVVYYTITAPVLRDDMVELDTSSYRYDGVTDWVQKALKDVKVTGGEGAEYQEGVDYEVSYEEGTVGVDAGTYSIKVSPVEGGKLLGGTVEKKFTVAPLDLSDGSIHIELADPSATHTYNGRAQTVEVKLVHTLQGVGVAGQTRELQAGVDYDGTLKYRDNEDVGTAYVWAEGMGNYTGTSQEISFVIDQYELTDENTVLTNFQDTMEYTGRVLEQKFSIRCIDTETLDGISDYEVVYAPMEPKNVTDSPVQVTINGKGNYKGSLHRTFTITPRDIKAVRIEPIAAIEYNGTTLEPKPEILYSSLDKTPLHESDYTLTYIDNINVGTATIQIEGTGNYVGMTSTTFEILARDISNESRLSVEADGMDAARYQFVGNGSTADERFYKFDNTEKKPAFAVLFDGIVLQDEATVVEGGKAAEYRINWGCDDYVNVGEVWAEIEGVGNYSGTKRVTYTIKGFLDDYNQSPGYTRIEVGDPEIYTTKPLTPKNVKVTFNGKALEEGKDYRFDTESGIDNTDVTLGYGKRASVQIEGMGDYRSDAYVEFDIRPLNLSTDDLEENHYNAKVKESYVYSGYPILAAADITHNGVALTSPENYTLSYYRVAQAEGGEELVEEPSPTDVGKYSIQISGAAPNYEGFCSAGYEITPYQIDEQHKDGSKVEILNVEDVVWDELAAQAEGADASAALEQNAAGAWAVVQKKLQVQYTPYNEMTGELGEPRMLTPDEYEVSYENNTTLGQASVTITGKGNFAGSVSETFRIYGDLSNADVKVGDCIYTPTKGGKSVSEPAVTVTYTLRHQGETIETRILEATDYQLIYENNENANADKEGSLLPGRSVARVTVQALTGKDGVPSGDFVNSKEASFLIRQRDITNAIDGITEVKDPLLDVQGLIAEGYEYTGAEIIPDLTVSCNGVALAKTVQKAGEALPESGYDYVVSATSNINVYEYAEDDVAKERRLTPTVTVTAKKDADGNYTGNYCGEFSMKFQINPRVIEEATVDNLVKIAGIENDVYDYTGNEIWFPKDAVNPKKDENAIVVVWCRTADDKTLLVENQDYTITYKDNTKIGQAKVIINAKEGGNYIGSYTKTFGIMASIEEANKEKPVYMTLDYDVNVPYAMQEIYPDLKFNDISGMLCEETDEPYILVGSENIPKDGERQDFVIVTEANKAECKAKYGYDGEVSRNNVNVASMDAEDVAARPFVVVLGIGYYKGVVKRYYNIIPKDLSEDEDDITVDFVDKDSETEDGEAVYIYNGKEVVPEIVVKNHGNAMAPNRDYVVEYVNNDRISTDTEKAGVVVKALDGSNYTGSKTFWFRIARKQLDSSMKVTVKGTAVFNRQPQEPEVEVSYNRKGEIITLTKDDYDVEYKNNVNAAKADSGEDAPTAIITGKGSYEGTLSVNFTIEPADIAGDDLIAEGESQVYTGKPLTTVFTMAAQDGTKLEEGKDFEVVPDSCHDNTDAGKGVASIRGMGNYAGTREASFDILPAKGEFRIAQIPAQTYNTKPLTPKVSVSLVVRDSQDSEKADSSAGDGNPSGEEKTIPMEEGGDYEVEYRNNVDAGTSAVVEVIGTGNFEGSAVATFTIEPMSIGTDGVAAAGMELGTIEDQLYTGAGVTPDVSLAFRNAAEEIDSVLARGRDYKISYSQNVRVGTAEATIEGIGNYAGSITASFRILGNLELAEVEDIPRQQYTGSAIMPKPEVSFAGEKLEEGVDYLLEYRNNIERGMATIVIAAITGPDKWYGGEKTVSFEIAREFSDADKITVHGVASAYTYTGEPIRPAVVLKDNDELLSVGTDYTVQYGENINAGDGSITITGNGTYSGTMKVSFKILPQSISRATTTKIADQIYDKKKKTPSVQVKNGNTELQEGVDYTVQYDKNDGPGKAELYILGKGNYSGTKIVSFNITVPKVTGVKAAKYSSNSMTLSWKRNSVVSGYEIYNSNNRRAALVGKNTVTKASVGNLKAGKAYTFRVRAFVIKDGEYHYSPFTSVKGATSLKTTKITSISSKKAKRVTLKWKKVSGATTYWIYRSTSKKGKYKKIGMSKKTSYTDKKASGGKKYFYKVCVCKKIGGKNYVSGYSSPKSVRAKKK